MIKKEGESDELERRLAERLKQVRPRTESREGSVLLLLHENGVLWEEFGTLERGKCFHVGEVAGRIEGDQFIGLH